MVRSIAQIVPYKICEKIQNRWVDSNAQKIFLKMHHPDKTHPNMKTLLCFCFAKTLQSFLLIKLTRPYCSRSTLPHASSQHTHMPTVAHFVTQFNSYVQHWFMQGFVQFHILISWLGISWMIYTTSDNNIVIGSATIISLLVLRARY